MAKNESIFLGRSLQETNSVYNLRTTYALQAFDIRGILRRLIIDEPIYIFATSISNRIYRNR